MSTYSYEVINRAGTTVTGQIEAEQEYAAVERLRKMGFTVVEVKEVRSSPFAGLFKSRRKVSMGDLSLFSRQLAAMLNAGIPLTRALFTLSEQVTNPTLKEALGETARNVEGGMSFTEALNAYPHIFSSLYVGMIHSGEVSGGVEQTLTQLANQLQKDKELRDNIRSASLYPIIVGVFALLVLLGMMFFLVPIFMGFFPPGADLPLPTRVIMAISDSLRGYWYIWFLVIAGAVLGVRYYFRTPAGKTNWDRWKIKIPAFGPLLYRAVVARYARTLATLLATGIPVTHALESAGRACGSSIIHGISREVGEKIHEGKSIAEPLEESGAFPPMVTHMIAVGEETGALPDLLTRIAEFYEEEVNTMTKGLAALIEPILLIMVGIVVGGMLLALYLPIFTVITQIS